MKKEYIMIILLVIAVVLGFIFYSTNEQPVEENILQYTAGCASDKIDASVYSLRGDTSLIGAFISFKEVPISEEVTTELNKLGVSMRKDSWIFDHGLAQIPTDVLCELAEHDFVTSIFIPKE
ncbi:MAG: hypothetical protein HOE19_04105 [Candidatus Komeilibacteria bacterium]|mgnify:FL=1|jgi:hypothetical protein|nr:hypothetical protein [Candidatus Komeilibacteria bacterium]MBT4447857.1 hypothetical protein [Candidatus Komeilibacteria bacterium]